MPLGLGRAGLRSDLEHHHGADWEQVNKFYLDLHARPEFEVELMAAEPLTMDPIAFAWGPDGKFWIVEMADYPRGIDGRGKPGGRRDFCE